MGFIKGIGTMQLQRRNRFILAALIALGWDARAAEEGFVSLVRGDDPQQFDLVDIGPDTIKIDNGEIRLTGRPDGYFATKESYKNYVLTFEWMYERSSDLGSTPRNRGEDGRGLKSAGPPSIPPSMVTKPCPGRITDGPAGPILPQPRLPRTRAARARKPPRSQPQGAALPLYRL